jgi:chorismate dehydratase
MPDKIRIGAVSYLNTRPLVFGLEQGLGRDRVELSYAVPSALAEGMAQGSLEVALLPIIELARIPDLEIVPGLAIGTRGPSRSVLLVSNLPIEHVRSVALDPESRTSNALTRVLLAEVWGKDARWIEGPRELSAALDSADAVVRIGDKALFETIPEGCRVFDLGEVWTDHTDLPFVFAAWIARPGVVDRELYRTLHESRRRGSREIPSIAEDYTWNGSHYPEVARVYLSEHIHFRLGAVELQALRLFFALAARHGVIDTAPELRLALLRDTECHEAAARLRELSRGAG